MDMGVTPDHTEVRLLRRPFRIEGEERRSSSPGPFALLWSAYHGHEETGEFVFVIEAEEAPRETAPSSSAQLIWRVYEDSVHGVSRRAPPSPQEPSFTLMLASEGPWMRYRGLIREIEELLEAQEGLVETEEVPEETAAPFSAQLIWRFWEEGTHIVSQRSPGRPDDPSITIDVPAWDLARDLADLTRTIEDFLERESGVVGVGERMIEVYPGFAVSSEEYETRYGGVDLDYAREHLSLDLFKVLVEGMGCVPGVGDLPDRSAEDYEYR